MKDFRNKTKEKRMWPSLGFHNIEVLKESKRHTFQV